MNVDIDVSAPPLPALSALAEPLRWRIMELLAGEELCVCHLVAELGVAQPLVSHHLRVLRRAGLVETSRYRLWTYYRLRREAFGAMAERLRRVAVEVPGGLPRRPCC